MVYKEGDHVSVAIPKKIRHSTDLRRLPCMVLNKSSGCYPTYKLLSEYGVVSKRVTGDNLEPYPGELHTGPPTKEITLSEAVRLFLKADVKVCHCKKSCNTKNCKCFSAKVLCTSRCHKYNTANCKNFKCKSSVNNQRTNLPILQLPVFGGTLFINDCFIRFYNTCAVDTWLTILYFFISSVNEKIISKLDSSLVSALKKGDFEKGKWIVAEKNKIHPINNVVNFYGNEYELIIKPFLAESFGRQYFSRCLCPVCPDPEYSSYIDMNPNFSDVATDVILTKESFREQMNQWFELRGSSPCKRPFGKEIPDEKYIFWENNSQRLVNL